MKHSLAVAATGLAVCGLAACGSSSLKAGSSPSDSATVTAPASPSDSAVPSTAASTDGSVTSAPATSASASVAPIGTSALPGVPAVTNNATELLKQPTVAAGTGTPSTGLVTRDLVLGTGTPSTGLTDTVLVHYTGSLFSNGKVFDASWTDGASNQEATFPLDQVVPGFGEGIVGMKVGGRREIVIPPALGYGSSGNAQAGISGTDTLVFIVDLDAVNPPQ